METNRLLNEFCPTIDELRAHQASARQDLEAHLGHCRRCRALVQLFGEAGEANVHERLEADAPAGSIEPVAASGETGESEVGHSAVEEGSLVVAGSPDAPGELLVAIVLATSSDAMGFRSLVVVPLSVEVRLATEWDLILDSDETPLGYPVIAELWNYGTLLRHQLVEHRGRVAAKAWQRVDALYALVLQGDQTEHGTPDGRGLAVRDDGDPRLLFQDEESERAGAFWMPAARALEHADGEAGEREQVGEAEELLTVGAILQSWLEEQGYDTGEYARTIGFDPCEVEAVRQNRVDPLTLNHDQLAVIIRRPQRDMEIDDDDLEAALGRSFIPDADWGLVGAYGSERAYGRTARLKGSERADALRRREPGSQPALSDKEVERRKSAYVRDVLASLEEDSES